MSGTPVCQAGLKIVAVALRFCCADGASQRASVERGPAFQSSCRSPENLEMVEPPRNRRFSVGERQIARPARPGSRGADRLRSAQSGRRLSTLTRALRRMLRLPLRSSPSSVAIRFEPRDGIVPYSISEGDRPTDCRRNDPADPRRRIIGPRACFGVAEAITERLGWVGRRQRAVLRDLGVASRCRLKERQNAASFAIVPAPEERQLTNVPVRARNLTSGLSARMTPPTVKVRVRGAKETINKIRDASIVAYVDLGGFGEGDYSLPVRLEPNAGIGVVNSIP